MREETGFDIRPLLVEEDCIEMHIGQQRSKLFIITGVRTPPQTRPYRCQHLRHCSHINCSCHVARTTCHQGMFSKCSLHPCSRAPTA